MCKLLFTRNNHCWFERRGGRSVAARPMQKETALAAGHLVDGRWQVIKVLGEGAFGAVYEAKDAEGHFPGSMALKIESVRAKVQVLKIEVAVCKSLQGKQHICNMFACGKNNKFNFMLMSILGPNLSQLRRKATGIKFSFSTTTRVTFHCMRAIKHVHDVGWLHRDVKPSNFAIGASSDTISAIYIFDFGLCRRFHIEEDEEIRPARANAGFRGTLRYCSMNAHKKVELGRHDDLISVMYMLVEMVKGCLPWRHLNDTHEVFRSKQQEDENLFSKLPRKLYAVHQYLQTLQYEDNPKYCMLEETILEIIYTMGYHLQPLDWEMKPTASDPPVCPESPACNISVPKISKPQDMLDRLDQVAGLDPDDDVEDLPVSAYTEE